MARKRKCKPPAALSGFVVQSGLATGRGAPPAPPRTSARSRVAQEVGFVPSMTPTIKVTAKGRGRKAGDKPRSSPKEPSAKRIKRGKKKQAAEYNKSEDAFAKALAFYYNHNVPGSQRKESQHERASDVVRIEFQRTQDEDPTGYAARGLQLEERGQAFARTC